MRIALLIGAGLDDAGGTTLAQEMEDYFKTRLTVFCFEKQAYGIKDVNFQRKNKSFVFFNNFKDLFYLIKDGQYDCLFIANMPLKNNKSFDKNMKNFDKLISRLKIVKVVLAIDRNSSMFKCGWCDTKYIKDIDYVFTLVNKENSCYKRLVKEFVNKDKVYNIDVNMFRYDREFYKKCNFNYLNKDDRMSFVGRFANFKGWQHYIHAFGKGILPKNYIHTCEGGLFSIKKQLSTTMGILSIICINKDIKNKVIYPYIELHSNYNEYENIKDKTKIHLFPTYSRYEMLKRLGKTKFLIIPYRFTNRGEGSFYMALEYVVLEAIAVGTPIILTKNFGKEFHIKNKPLIEYDCGLIFFNNFEEIKEKVEEYCLNYDNNVKVMQNFFFTNYTSQDKEKNIFKIISKNYLQK